MVPQTNRGGAVIEVRISDSMASATMIDRHAEIAASEPVYALTSRKAGKHSRVYSGDRAAWLAWLRICEGNAEGAMDEPAARRASRQAADRIQEALSK